VFPESVSWARVALAPDGVFEADPSFEMGVDPTAIFLPLPRTTKELEEGWKRTLPIEDYRISGSDRSPRDGSRRRFRYEIRSSFTKVYDRTARAELEFDPAGGRRSFAPGDSGSSRRRGRRSGCLRSVGSSTRRSRPTGIA